VRPLPQEVHLQVQPESPRGGHAHRSLRNSHATSTATF
jgi:hypothetical protein